MLRRRAAGEPAALDRTKQPQVWEAPLAVAVPVEVVHWHLARVMEERLWSLEEVVVVVT